MLASPRRWLELIAVVFTLFIASWARGEAAAGLDPAAAAKLLAPYLDGQTLAVGRLDVTRVDVAALLDEWVELLPAARRDADDLRPLLTKLRSSLVEAGVADAYVVLSQGKQSVANQTLTTQSPMLIRRIRLE